MSTVFTRSKVHDENDTLKRKMSLDERIHELYNRVAATKDPDELCEIAGLLRAAFHAQIEYLSNSVTDVIRNTPYGTTLLKLSHPSSDRQCKLPTSDYSTA